MTFRAYDEHDRAREIRQTIFHRRARMPRALQRSRGRSDAIALYLRLNRDPVPRQ